MIWLVQDFGFLSVVLRALLLTLQTLTVGGILFLALVRPHSADPAVLPRLRTWIARCAAAMALAALLYVATDSTILYATNGLTLPQLAGADYFVSGCLTVLLALLAAFVARPSTSARAANWLLPTLAVALMVNTVFTSHAVSRAWITASCSARSRSCTQGAAAAWIGGIAFLLLALRHPALEPLRAQGMLHRFTAVAVTSVVTLAATGILLSTFYIASLPALYGTSYGIMVVSKAVMLGFLVAIGAANFRAGRESRFGRATVALLRRMSEFELLVAFAVLLLAASLTSQPPGVDLVEGRLTLPDLAQHYRLRAPILHHPPLESLAPATPIEESLRTPDNDERAAAHTNGDPDVAWSEFEHNWAGLFLMLIGVLGVISAYPRGRWARWWPLVFIVMAAFLIIFSDPENWPLGPIGYWQSFSDPEVLVHRIALSFLMIFGVFEAGVQTGRLGMRAAMVFPILDILAASALLLHSHALGNVRLETFTEISHTPIAIFGLLAGAFRLLQIWLTYDRTRLGRKRQTAFRHHPHGGPGLALLALPCRRHSGPLPRRLSRNRHPTGSSIYQGEPPMSTTAPPTGHSVTLDEARQILAAATKEAESQGQPMNIAVVCSGGHLLAFERMHNAWIGSVDIAQKKAWTSRAFDIETKVLGENSQSGDQFFGIHASKRRQGDDLRRRRSAHARW